MKPSPGTAVAHCLAEAHAALLDLPDCRFQRPVAPRGGGEGDGAWEIDGWTAWRWIEGEPAPKRAREIVVTARSYHATLATLPRDDALLGRTDPWARADRVAWGEARADYPSDYIALLEPFLRGTLLTLPSQRIHADLTGNVVFAEGLAPGIIDPTHYWRPIAFAEAIVLVDQGWFARVPDPTPFADTPALPAMLRRAGARRIAEQAEQVAARMKEAAEALATARSISVWTSALLDQLARA